MDATHHQDDLACSGDCKPLRPPCGHPGIPSTAQPRDGTVYIIDRKSGFVKPYSEAHHNLTMLSSRLARLDGRSPTSLSSVLRRQHRFDGGLAGWSDGCGSYPPHASTPGGTAQARAGRRAAREPRSRSSRAAERRRATTLVLPRRRPAVRRGQACPRRDDLPQLTACSRRARTPMVAGRAAAGFRVLATRLPPPSHLLHNLPTSRMRGGGRPSPRPVDSAQGDACRPPLRAEPFGVVGVLVPRQAAIHGLSEQGRQSVLHVLVIDCKLIRTCWGHSTVGFAARPSGAYGKCGIILATIVAGLGTDASRQGSVRTPDSPARAPRLRRSCSEGPGRR